jgi:hypothetical protein
MRLRLRCETEAVRLLLVLAGVSAGAPETPPAG